MTDINCIHIQIQLFCMNIRLKNVAQIMQNVRQAARLFFQMYFPALNTAHIQNIVYQAQQMIS